MRKRHEQRTIWVLAYHGTPQQHRAADLQLRKSIPMLLPNEYIGRQIWMGADIKTTKMDAWRDRPLPAHSQDRDRFLRSEIDCNFSVRCLPLGEYIFRQIWIGANNTTTANDTWRNNNLQHARAGAPRSQSISAAEKNREGLPLGEYIIR